MAKHSSQKRTLHAFDDLFRDRAEDHRPPTRDAVGGNHNHVDVLSFDYQHDVSNHLIANLDS
jgi:hypothetical protein